MLKTYAFLLFNFIYFHLEYSYIAFFKKFNRIIILKNIILLNIYIFYIFQ